MSDLASLENIIKALADIAFLDPAELLNPDGTVKDLHKMPLAARRAISSLDVKELYLKDGTHCGSIHKVRMESKIKALELLGKNLAMFTDKVQHGVEDDLANLILAARKRTVKDEEFLK